MSLPGINVYALATRLIGKQDYIYYKQLTRDLDDRGIYISTYAAGVPLKDSIQPVKRILYSQMGLDRDRYYIFIYTESPLLVVERGTSGDQIEFNGARFELQSNTDWIPQDHWEGVLAVRLEQEVPI